MRVWLSIAGLLLAVVLGAGSLAVGEPSDDFAGAFTYRTYCLSCHGPEGRGDGPAAESLRFQPPDLRLIARRNGGKFPADRMRQIVDGRKPVKGYVRAEMPVFGDVFRSATDGYDEELAQLQIRAVVAYLQTLQVR